MSEMTISIVLYGNFNIHDTKSWLNFYDYGLDLFEQYSFNPNYIGIIGNDFTSGKVLSLKRTEKRLMKSLGDSSCISSMAFYSLPKGFTQAAFDYLFYLGRTWEEENPSTSHIILTFPENLYNSLNISNLCLSLKEYIDFKEGQIFKMSRYECPMFYASKVNEPKDYSTFKVLFTL